MAARKRNPADATLRNTRAAAKRQQAAAARIAALQTALARLGRRVDKAEWQIRALAAQAGSARAIESGWQARKEAR